MCSNIDHIVSAAEDLNAFFGLHARITRVEPSAIKALQIAAIETLIVPP